MVLGIQIVGFLFGLFMIYYSFLNYKKKEFTVKEFGAWILIWAVFMMAALFPYLLDPIVKKIGFLRALDLLTIGGFLFMIAAIFYTYTITRKTQKQLETMIRAIAMKKNKGK